MKSLLTLICISSLAMAQMCVDNEAPRFQPKNKPLGCYVLNRTMPDTLNGLSSLSQPDFGFSDPYVLDRDDLLMDDGLCVAHCADYLFTFAALRRGEECRCGKDDGLKSYKQVDASQCNTTCIGNNTSVCGGQDAYTVYGNVIAELPNAKVTKISIDQKINVIRDLSNDSSYKGCIPDSLVCRREALMQETFDMTIETCATFCKDHGFQNAGLESGTRCICIEDYEYTDLLRPEDCSSSCAGNSSTICGGPAAISIYAADTIIDNSSPLKPLISAIIAGVTALIAVIIITHRSRKQIARFWARLRGKVEPTDAEFTYSVKDPDVENTHTTDSTTHLTTSHVNSSQD